MSGPVSKRQAARNEKALQELVHNIQGNNFCADCEARNPSWASWSLGIFLCMRCASIHRKLGTHISKVKSLTMDSWSNEQVDNMRKVGNLASNKIYNPQGKKPSVPVDIDEADSAMERFIRQKYMNGGFKSAKRNSHGSTVSDEGTPPPLPPKTPSKISSFLSLGGRKKDRSASHPHDSAINHRLSPGRGDLSPRYKAGKAFGISVEYGVGDEMERKMVRLRDMGFTDEQRNALVLKGMHGNMEKTVEALVRLGEGGRSSSVPSPQDPPTTNQSLTPMASSSGLSLAPSSPSTSNALAPRPTSAMSNNPFDNIRPSAKPQSAQSTGTLSSNTNPFLRPQNTGTNPFGIPTQLQQPNANLTQSLQNLNLAPTTSLFPNHTGGIPAQQNFPQLYQQPSTQTFSPMNFSSTMSFPPAHPLQSQATGYNPFLQPTAAHPNQGIALNTNSTQNTFGTNPYAKSPTRMQSPSPLAQIPEAFQATTLYSSPKPLQSPSTNPFFTTVVTPAPSKAQTAVDVVNPYQQAQQFQQSQQPQLFQQSQLQQFQQSQQPQQFQKSQQMQQQIDMYQQQPQRADKASIMELFNYPQLAPPKPNTASQQPQEKGSGGSAGIDSDKLATSISESRRTVSTPLPGSNNPFMNGLASTSGHTMAATPRTDGVTTVQKNGGDGAAPSHNSRDSIALGIDMGWTNGRHSPDAFASLSARAGF